MKSPLEYGKDFIMKPKIDFAFKKVEYQSYTKKKKDETKEEEEKSEVLEQTSIDNFVKEFKI